MYQPFGRGLGHIGSTSNRGAVMPPPPCADACFSKTRWPTPNAARRATKLAPMNTFRRFMVCVPLILATGDELLDALAVVLLARVHVALRVDGDAADGQEASRLASALSNRADFVERGAIEDAHLLVLAVRDEQVALLRIVRERDVPHRSERGDRAELARDDGAAGVLGDDRFLHELAGLAEHLDAVAGAVADV